MKKIIADIIEYVELLWLTNPVLNPSVMSITPITFKSPEGVKVTRYRLRSRRHYFDTWKEVGSYSTFEEALNEGLDL